MNKSYTRKLLEVLLPKFCYGCGSVGEYICAYCKVYKLRQKYQQVCHISGYEVDDVGIHQEAEELTYLDGVMSYCFYDDLVELIIKRIKYDFYHSIIQELAHILSQKAWEYDFWKGAVFTFVPLHVSRLKWRGFNQSYLLGKAVASSLQVDFSQLLYKPKATSTQVGKERAERLRNLKNAFIPMFSAFTTPPRKVVLVDDVFTTGATLENCAMVLKEHGVEEVYGIVFATGVQPKLYQE